jgi:hypothetical protein
LHSFLFEFGSVAALELRFLIYKSTDTPRTAKMTPTTVPVPIPAFAPDESFFVACASLVLVGCVFDVGVDALVCIGPVTFVGFKTLSII